MKIFSLILAFWICSLVTHAQVKKFGTGWHASIIREKMGGWYNSGQNFTAIKLANDYVLPRGLVKGANIYGNAKFLDILDSTGRILSMKLLSLEIYNGSGYKIKDNVQFVFDDENSRPIRIGITFDSLDKVKLMPETSAVAKWLLSQELKNRIFKRLPVVKTNTTRPQKDIKNINEFYHITNFNISKSPIVVTKK